jgi:hypothetical protein
VLKKLYRLSTIIENGTPYGFNAIQKVDHQTGELKYDFGAGRLSSEVNFIPQEKMPPKMRLPDLDRLQPRPQKSEVVILDARKCGASWPSSPSTTMFHRFWRLR